jgi:plastocyanin
MSLVAKLLFGAVVLGGLGFLGGGQASANDVVIPVQNFSFPAVTNVSVGDKVRWQMPDTFPHTVTECGPSCPPAPMYVPLFDSGIVPLNGTYDFVFTTAGTYNYWCEVHGTLMEGDIVVSGSVGGIAEIETAGLAPAVEEDRGSGRTALVGALAALAAMATAAIAGAAWYGRRWLAR